MEGFFTKFRQDLKQDLREFSCRDRSAEGRKADFNAGGYRVFFYMHGSGFQNLLTCPASGHQSALARTARSPAAGTSVAVP